MPYREMTFWDLVPTARILNRAFQDDSLMGEHLHPYRKQYPDDMYLFHLRGLRMNLFGGPDRKNLVSYETTKDGKQRLTGYAIWVRKRKVPLKKTLYQRFMQTLVSAYNRVEEIFRPNRALEPSRLDILNHLDPLMEQHLVGDRQELWYLSFLGVDPEAQKSGQGRQLLSYGLERAKAEDIPAGVMSSHDAEGFYRRCGFTVDLGRIGSEKGDDNPLKDIAGGRVFFTR